MPLTLRIISPQKELLGAESTKVFSVHGGTIGRAPDNDWVLPDPERFVSAHHAIIDYQDGAYYLTDTSSNGVFVNDSDQSVGSGAPIRLHNSDRLRMGHYRFTVSIVNVGRDGTADTGIFVAEDAPDEKPADSEDSERRAKASARARLRAGGLDLQLVEEPPTRPTPVKRRDTEQLTIIENVHDTVSTSAFTQSARAADGAPDRDDSSAETQPVEELQQAALRESLELLLDATGADPKRVRAGEEIKLLGRLGRVLRAAMDGLSRAMGMSDRPALPEHDDSLTHHPLRGPGELGDKMNELLFDDPLQDATPDEAVEEAFADLQAHQVALARAGRAAWLDLLDRMAPATLEASFGKGLTRGSLLGISNKSKYWDLYREFYEDLARQADERFGEVFEETYRRIYKAERDRRAFREKRQAPVLPVAD
jgi:type VI secretion system FHA domain protein